MKKIIMIGIPILIIVLLLIGYHKYIYVPAGAAYNLKFDDLRKETNGNVNEIKTELTKNGIHTRISFQKVGNSVTYHFKAINNGTIPAKLALKPKLLSLDYMFKKNIFTTLTYENNEEIKKGDMINPGEEKELKLEIIFQEEGEMAGKDGYDYEVTGFLLYLQKR